MVGTVALLALMCESDFMQISDASLLPCTHSAVHHLISAAAEQMVYE
jgi:hypothetical protein